MVNIKIYQVDAFTNQLFGGNPAAICALDQWLPDSLMQKIAAENNLSETAFFVPNSSDNRYELRWFTPTVEVDLCGHATLATAHIIFTEMSPTNEEISFQTRNAGELTVTRQKETALYTLNFPARPADKTDLPDGLLSALGSGITPISIYKARDYLLVYENEADIKQLSPDFTALGKLDAVFAVIVTAPGDEVDFVSRFFAPSAGVNEDPVCGSAHCTLTPYWAERLGKNQLHAYQISARKGELWCEHKDDRVLLSGKAVTYLKGEINI
jgi:PhzF family phenazine biosynthesis protein